MDDRSQPFVIVSEDPPRKSRYVQSWKRLRLGCISICLLIMIDWVIWKYRDHQVITAASEMGGDVGGLLGWPIGYDYSVFFNFIPTDQQLERLAVLNNPPRGSSVGVWIRSCEVSESDVNRISEALSNCRVYWSCDEELKSESE